MTTAHLYDIDRLPHPRPPSEQFTPAMVRFSRNGTTVTDRAVVTASGSRYPITDLDALYTSRGPVPTEVVLAVGVTATLAVALLLVSIVRHSPNPYLVGLAGALLTTAVGRLATALRPRRLVLLATRGPGVVILHSSTDHRTVGQVGRAVQRAMERASDRRTGRLCPRAARAAPRGPLPRRPRDTDGPEVARRGPARPTAAPADVRRNPSLPLWTSARMDISARGW